MNPRALGSIAALTVMLAASVAGATTQRQVSPDRALHLDLAVGDMLVVQGTVATTHDGVVWDAVTHDGGRGPEPLGLYVTEGVGLRVMQHDGARHLTRFQATGASAPACAAAGVAAPCLLPRVDALAHERLLTVDAFVATLGGSVTVAEVPAPPPVSRLREVARVVGSVAALALPLVALAFLFLARRRRTSLGRVHAAAAEARAATRLDPTMARVGAEIDGLVARAADLERARAGHARRRARLDRPAIERKLSIWAKKTGRGAEETLRWLREERAEIDKLDADLAACDEAIEQIEASLRVIALAGRARRDERPLPLSQVRDELSLRERARAELEGS